MSDSPSAGFGKFVPGFDFLQNLAKGASETLPQMPNLSNWIAPTLNVEELDKRISELKTVHFWLEQNAKALAATVQALEVQKMTLVTLKGMNFSIGEMAKALNPKAPDVPSASKAAGKTASSAASESASAPQATPEKVSAAARPAPAATSGLVDPLQLWGALTQQFQQIAASAMTDAGKTAAAMDMSKTMAASFAKEAAKSDAKPAAKAGAKPRAPAKKSASKTTGRSA